MIGVLIEPSFLINRIINNLFAILYLLLLLLTAGMITKTEIKLLDQVDTPHGKWWVPFVWSCNLVRAARRQGRISDNYLMKALLDVCTVFAFIIRNFIQWCYFINLS